MCISKNLIGFILIFLLVIQIEIVINWNVVNLNKVLFFHIMRKKIDKLNT